MSRTRPYLGRGLTIFRFMSVPPVSTSTCPPVALSIRRLVHPQTCLCEPGPSATIATRLCLSVYSLIMGEPSLRSQVVIASSPDRQLQPGGEMPARPSDQSMRERIVAAAIQVIRERGVTHATTREIARAAKVSEGSIYNHFENKTALFGAAFGAVTGGIRGAMREVADSVGSGMVEGNLERLAATAIRFYGELLPMTGSALADHDVSAWLRRRMPERGGGPIQGHAALIAYLEAEREAGRLGREADPPFIAAALLGACLQYAFLSLLAEPAALAAVGLPPDVDEYARRAAHPGPRPPRETARSPAGPPVRASARRVRLDRVSGVYQDRHHGGSGRGDPAGGS